MAEKQESLRISGVAQFPASVESAWDYLTTPKNLSNCTPGLISWQEKRTNHFFVHLAWITPAKAQIIMPLTIHWHTLTPPIHLHFSISTQPSNFGTVGTIACEGDVHFKPISSAQTELAFTAVLNTPNPFFKQLIKNVLPKQIDSFIACLTTKFKPC